MIPKSLENNNNIKQYVITKEGRMIIDSFILRINHFICLKLKIDLEILTNNTQTYQLFT